MDPSIQLAISVVVPAGIALVFWNQIRLATNSLQIPEVEKRRIALLAGVALFGWLLLAIVLGLLDAYHVTPQLISPGVPIGFALPVLIGIYLMNNSKAFQGILDRLPQNILIMLQLPRVIGIIFLFLYFENRLPGLFAIPSGVGDLVVGLSAPLVAHFYGQGKPWSRNLAVAWNAVGVLDLLTAIALGIILVLPPPLQLVATTPTTELMTTFPMVLVPVFAVPLGLLLHLFSLRLLKENKKR